jgi:hypothetical protein
LIERIINHQPNWLMITKMFYSQKGFPQMVYSI